MSTYHNIYEENIEHIEQELNFDRRIKNNFIALNFYNTVISTFGWGNLPKETLPFMPEEQLCFTGKTIFFLDDNGNPKLFPGYMAGNLMENGMYDRYQIIAKNGKVWTRKYDEIEICFNNSMRFPSAWQVNSISEDCSYALRSVKTALQRTMIPAIITGSTNEQLAEISKLKNPENNLELFYTAFNSAISKSDHSVIDFFDNTKEDVIARWDIFIRFRNLFYTTFGINNVEIQKKERLTESEGESNQEITRYTLLQDMLHCRQDFCERVDKKFGHKLEVYLNRDTQSVYETLMDNEDKIERMELENLKGVNLPEQNKEREEKDDVLPED